MADRPHPSSIAGGPYDGTTFSYIPGPTLNIDPSLATLNVLASPFSTR